MYRKQLGNIKIILLLPSYDETYERFLRRHSSVTESEFVMLYRLAQDLAIFDEKIDNTAVPAEEVAKAVNSFF